MAQDGNAKKQEKARTGTEKDRDQDEERIPGTTDEGMHQAALRPSGSGGSATPEDAEDSDR